MKIKTLLLSFLCVMSVFVMNAGNSVALTLNTGLLAKMTCTYDASTGVYSCKSTDISPLIYTTGLAAALPDDYITLSFEYQTDKASQFFQVFFGNTFNATRQKIFDGLKVASDWTTYSVSIKSCRTDFSWGNATEMLMFHFAGMPSGSTFKLRNIKISSPVDPFKNIEVKTNTATTVQAEDYNIGGLDASYGARQYPNVDQPAYTNPASTKFPILAWGSLPSYLSTKARFQELADCGFNLSLQKFGATQDIINALDSCGDTGVSLFVNFWGLSSIDECAGWFKDTKNFAGWFIGDEPFSSKFAEYGALVSKIRASGSTRLSYCNLFNSGTDVGALGTKSYADYLQRFVREVGTGFLSFDMYPIMTDTATKKDYVKTNFYQNLELVSMVAKQYKIPFWAFARSVASEEDVNYHVFYPIPTKKNLRYQVFSDLAYGAQGIQYYSYCDQSGANWTYHDSPLDASFNRTAVWYLVQDVNKEIQNHAWVFLGAHDFNVTFSGTSTTIPVGTKLYSDAVLPSNIQSITTSGRGVLVSQFKNGNNNFVMVMNSDFDSTQTVTVKKGVSLNLVNADGSVTEDATAEKSFTLAPAEYFIYQWATPTAPSALAPANRIYKADTTYRADTQGVVIRNDENYENKWALYDMGDNWEQYTLGLYAYTYKTSVTKAQAIENWGSWYTYDVTVPQDIDVNIFFKHNVSWDKFGKIGATGTPDINIYRCHNLNYTKRYNASMILQLDGTNVPTNQKLRPVAPDTYEEDGATFNTILSDKSKWISTLNTKTTTDTLWFWPQAGGVSNAAPYYNDEPDYAAVHLTAGTHRFKVQSLSSAWDFDCFKLVDVNYSGVDGVNKNAVAFTAFGRKGSIYVKSDVPAQVYTLTGALIGEDVNGTVEVPAGVYIVRAGANSKKVVVR
jgi:hypothetical protein